MLIRPPPPRIGIKAKLSWFWRNFLHLSHRKLDIFRFLLRCVVFSLCAVSISVYVFVLCTNVVDIVYWRDWGTYEMTPTRVWLLTCGCMSGNASDFSDKPYSEHAEVRKLSRCQLCRLCPHRKLSLRQPPVSQVKKIWHNVGFIAIINVTPSKATELGITGHLCGESTCFHRRGSVMQRVRNIKKPKVVVVSALPSLVAPQVVVMTTCGVCHQLTAKLASWQLSDFSEWLVRFHLGGKTNMCRRIIDKLNTQELNCYFNQHIEASK